MNIAIVETPGAMRSAIFGVQELLQIANRVIKLTGGDVVFECAVLPIPQSIEGQEAKINCDAVIIPPLLQHDGRIQSLIDENKSAVSWLRSLKEQPINICGCCTAVVLLAEAGLLERRKATSTWWLINEISERYSSVDLLAHEMLVQDENIVTSAGPFSYISQCLALIERYASPEASRLCAKIAVVEPGRPMNGIFSVPSLVSSDDPLLIAAQEFITQYASNGITVGELASELGYSERTLHRKLKERVGLSTQQFISAVRLEIAKSLLETTALPIIAVSEAIGFRNESSFRSHFASTVGVTPTVYRARMNPVSSK